MQIGFNHLFLKDSNKKIFFIKQICKRVKATDTIVEPSFSHNLFRMPSISYLKGKSVKIKQL
jgi:hypothetical protein